MDVFAVNKSEISLTRLDLVELINVRILFIGLRAPLSSKRPLLSVSISVCLFVCLFVYLFVCAMPNASSPTVLNPVLRNIGTVFS